MTETKFTPGPWSVGRPKGWASLCITAPSRDGVTERPLATLVTQAAYYTDFPTRTDEDGKKWTVCSHEAARKAGNYVATAEIRDAINAQQERDAHLIAAAPDMYEALSLALERLKGYAEADEVANGYGAGCFARPDEFIEATVTTCGAALAKARGKHD